VLAISKVAYGLSPQKPAEPEIAKDDISIHEVQRGTMPLRLMGDGEIVSLRPPQALVRISASATPPAQIGQKASIQVKPPAVLAGRVVDVDRAVESGFTKVKIELDEPLPKDVALGAKLGSLIEVGELKDVVFFAKPANARPNSEMALFVIEQNGQFAKRTEVRWGVQSGPLIQILSGLSPGDRVIVTDTSKWESYERLRLK
jgi:HlyD family secretion protein